MNCFKNYLYKALLISAYCLLLHPIVAVGQSHSNFKKLSKNEGLSQASVFAIEEDIDGFLWFGTREGLNRYDGYNFSVIRSNSDGTGIAGNDVRTLYSDPANGDLWEP
jgi:ligand-binding sensor domain-containing protein